MFQHSKGLKKKEQTASIANVHKSKQRPQDKHVSLIIVSLEFPIVIICLDLVT